LKDTKAQNKNNKQPK